MKLNLLFTRTLYFLFGLLVTANCIAGEIRINDEGENKILLLENTYHQLLIKNNLEVFDLLDLDVDSRSFQRIQVNGYTPNLEYGHPELPVNRKLIEVPFGAELEVNIIRSSFVEYDLAELSGASPLYPAQPPRSKSEDLHEFVIDDEAYQLNSYGDKELAWVDDLGIMRGLRIARLNVAPFHYNPVKNSLRIYSEIEVEIYFRAADIPQTLEMKKKNISPYFAGLSKTLLNYKALSGRENFMRYPVKYVIISDRMFETQLQPLIDWKTKKGFSVVEAYTDQPEVGNTTTSIKAYIEDLYNQGTPEDPAPSFVLFVGDIQQIPAWENGNGETDRLYCEYTNDLFPEIYYGRMSAQTTAQLQPQIDKTLQYEQYTMPDPTYLDEVVMVAGVDGSHGYDWGNGQINYGTINYFNPDHNIISHTYLYPESGSSSAQIIQNISDGVTFGNYTAHCSPSGWADPSFTISDIPTLQNENMYCLLIGNCCSSSEFAQNECFSEAILRAVDKGCVGYIGASNSTYWDEDYYFGVGVGQISQNPPPYEETTLGLYDRAFHDHGEPFLDWYVTQDEMIFAGNLAVTEGSPGSAEYYWDVYNISGDPSLMIYFSNPPEISVSYEPLLPLNTTPFEVTTEPWAYVAISLNGVLHGAALADSLGNAVVNIIPFTTPGNADVVVTKQNGQPYTGTVLVANPEGPYLMLESFVIVDTLGNANSNVDFGEQITLDVELENLGNSDAVNARATLSTDDDYVTISDDYQDWGTIPAHSTATEYGAYGILVDEVVPDQHIVNFDLLIEDDSDEVWNATLDITLNAPELVILNMIVDDSEFGNNNGRLDPGETADLKVLNRNSGHCIAEDATGTLESICHYLTIENNVDTIGDLGFFGDVWTTYRVIVDPETPDGAILAYFDYSLTSGAYVEEKEFVRKIGLIFEDFETGDFTKFDWEMDGDEPWTITMDYPYEGFFSAMSGAIGNNKTSELKITVEVMTADSISFIRKISSEENADKLKFYIDGQLKGEWSGAKGWEKQIFPVSTGWHTFKWIYAKNGAGASGADCAWLDYIVFPPLMCLTVYAGPDDLVCIGDDYQCHGEATDYVSVEWSTSGTGTFDDPYILEPVYTPSEDDYTNGEVTLSLMATDADGETADDEIKLIFITEPETPQKPTGPEVVDVAINPSSEYTTAPVDLADEYSWLVYPENAGSITGTGITGTVVWDPAYFGTAGIKVKALNECGESEWSEVLDVTVNNTVAINERPAQESMQIFPNPFNASTNIEISLRESSRITVSVFNAMGQKIEDLRQEKLLPAGLHRISLDGSNMEKGIYYCVFSSKNNRITKKIILVK